MAFEATHVRFALDLQQTLDVVDASACSSGAVYPDSRYVTRTPRKLTHELERLLKSDAAGLSDFEKGWRAHLLYDRAAGPFYVSHSKWPDEAVVHLSPQWMYASAEKIIEDRQSCLAMGERFSMLQQLACPMAPQGEDQEALEKYYRDLRDFYRKIPELADYRQLFADFGISEEIAKGTVAFAEEIAADDRLVETIAGFYSAILAATADIR